MYSPFPLLVETERQIALLRANRIRLLHCLFRLIFRKTFLLCQFFETFSIDVVLVHVCPNGGRVGRRSTTTIAVQVQTANQISNHILLRARHVNLLVRRARGPSIGPWRRRSSSASSASAASAAGAGAGALSLASLSHLLLFFFVQLRLLFAHLVLPSLMAAAAGAPTPASVWSHEYLSR